MYRRMLIGGGLCLLLAGCARMTAQRLTSERLAATDRLYASFELDRIHLATTVHAALVAEGLTVAPSKAEAELLLTGIYSASYEEGHYRFDWAQLKLVRQQTGQVLLIMHTEYRGLQTVEDMVQTIVAEIKHLY